MDTSLATNWNPAIAGTHTISATLIDQLNNQLVDTIEVTVGDGTPTAISIRTMAAGAAGNLLWIMWLWMALMAFGTAVMLFDRRKNKKVRSK